MIPANKSPWFTRLFSRHARSRIVRTFGRVFVGGLDGLRAACARGPVLVVANHPSWWDPLIILWLTNVVLRTDSYAMMDAVNLRRLPFFGRVGAFGVDLDVPADGARAIRYAAKLLDRPGRVVWIYPEGRERSPFEKLDLLPGAALVGRLARDAQVIAIGVRYVFAGNERPDLWLSIGAPQAALRSSAEGLAQQHAAITEALTRIDTALAIASPPVDFELIHETRPSKLALFAERSLAWFSRFF